MLSRLGIQMESPLNKAQLDFLIFGGIVALSYFKPIAGSAIIGGYVLSHLISSQGLTDPDEEYLPIMFRVMNKVADAIRVNPKLYFVLASLGYVAGAIVVKNLCDSYGC